MPNTKTASGVQPPPQHHPPKARRESLATEAEQKVPSKLVARRILRNVEASKTGPGKLGRLYGKRGGARTVARLPDEAIEDLVYDRLQGEELSIYKWAATEAIGDLAMDVLSLSREAQGKVRPKNNKSSILVDMAEEAGIMIPGLGTLMASAKLSKEVIKLIDLLKEKKTVVGFESKDAQAATFLNLGLDGMRELIGTQSRYTGVMVGTYTYDVATSVVDFTGLSRLPSLAIRSVSKVIAAVLAKRRAIELNKALSERKEFNLSIFRKNPLLSCYLVHRLDAGELMGLYDAFYVEDAQSDDKERLEGYLDERDLQAIDIFDNKIQPLKQIALAKIRANAFCFADEAQARNNQTGWDFVKSKTSDPLKDLPEKLKKLKTNSAEYLAVQKKMRQEREKREEALWEESKFQALKADSSLLPQRRRRHNDLSPLERETYEREQSKVKEARGRFKRAEQRYHKETLSLDGDREKVGKRMAEKAKVMREREAKYRALRKKYKKLAPDLGAG